MSQFFTVDKRKGPWFDPARLEMPAGRKDLFKMARKYYQVTHDAIRRYDAHHLILGDRYEAKAPLPGEILEAATPYDERGEAVEPLVSEATKANRETVTWVADQG